MPVAEEVEPLVAPLLVPELVCDEAVWLEFELLEDAAVLELAGAAS